MAWPEAHLHLFNKGDSEARFSIAVGAFITGLVKEATQWNHNSCGYFSFTLLSGSCFMVLWLRMDI